MFRKDIEKSQENATIYKYVDKLLGVMDGSNGNIEHKMQYNRKEVGLKSFGLLVVGKAILKRGTP